MSTNNNERTMKTGLRVVRVFAVSGNANNTSNAEAFYVNANNGVANTNANYSGRLSYLIKNSAPRRPCLLAKHKEHPESVSSWNNSRKLWGTNSRKDDDLKRKGHLFEQVVSIDNLMLAHENARRGKAHYREVQAFDGEPMKHVLAIREMLINETYDVGEYEIIIKVVDSGKSREIFKLSYDPHRVIQHAIIQVLEPTWTGTLINDTHCCIKGRGIHLAGEKIKKALREDPEGTKYCLKIDIRKYYPSIDHGIMKEIVRRKIKDPKLLRLIDKIIDSSPGLPIGNYLSQYLANLYLSPLDHFCKEALGIKYYFRYCDDIVILHASKDALHSIRKIIDSYLYFLKLEIKDNWQVFPVDARGIDFLGYRYFRGYTLIRKRIARKALRSASRLRKLDSLSTKQFQSIISYLGWLKHANALNLYNAIYDVRIKCLVRGYTARMGIRNPLLRRVR